MVIRSIFKFFDHVFNVQNAKHIGDYYKIAGALINRYHPLIEMEGATVELVRNMLQQSQRVNIVQRRVEAGNLCRRNAQWQRLNQQVPNFPHLEINYLS